MELNAAFQVVLELGIAAGREGIGLGARPRYEIVPEFAPYVGVHWKNKLGATVDSARAVGDRASGGFALFGIRVWF